MNSSNFLLIVFFVLFIENASAGPYGIRQNYRNYNNNNNNYRTYNGYGNYYRNRLSYYQTQPRPYYYYYPQQYQYTYPASIQPSYANPQPAYSSNGVGIDTNGNSYIGTPSNGIYLFCNGKGCPGRG